MDKQRETPAKDELPKLMPTAIICRPVDLEAARRLLSAVDASKAAK